VSKFISAKDGPNHTVIYTDSEGREFEYAKGDRAWRNNNPGNLVSGNVSRRNNQIGKAGGFAVFPDYETGHRALLDCLNTTFINSMLKTLIKAYAPKHENNTANYLKHILNKVGVTKDTKVKDLTPKQFEKLWQAIELMEGPKKGTIKELPAKLKITRVKKNKKGTIVGYFIPEIGWVSKIKGIQLAKAGKIDAVIAKSRNGNFFLRTKPDVIVENNLKSLG
jgi:hypothetical protein